MDTINAENRLYQRDLWLKIKPYLHSSRAVVITGMRRSGKTSLLQFIFQRINSDNKIFLDLGNPVIRCLFEEEDYETIKINLEREGLSFSEKRPAYIFLDEIQFLRGIPSVVKYFIDHYQTKFFLTGSASFYLKNLFSESLAGRKYLFELYPLSFREFLGFKGIRAKASPSSGRRAGEVIWQLQEPLVKEYLEFGAFSEVVLAERTEEKNKLLDEIFSSYFQKEIGQLSNFKKVNLVRDLIILLAENVGSLVNIAKLSSELGVSRLTLQEWLGFLEATYLINLTSPYSRSQRVAIRKAKKSILSIGRWPKGLLRFRPGKRLRIVSSISSVNRGHFLTTVRKAVRRLILF